MLDHCFLDVAQEVVYLLLAGLTGPRSTAGLWTGCPWLDVDTKHELSTIIECYQSCCYFGCVVL